MKEPDWILPEGDEFYQRFKDRGELYTYTEGSWNIAKQFLPQKRIAIDVGAHIGTFTLRYSKNFEYVYAIEPIYHTELAANKFHFRMKNVQCVPFAASNIEENLPMKIRKVNSGRAEVMKFSNEKLNSSWKKVFVPTITLDSLSINEVDFIKIDVENYNLPVLIGAKDTIKRNKPLIQIELPNNYDQKPRQWLTKMGYKQVAQYDVDKFFQHESMR